MTNDELRHADRVRLGDTDSLRTEAAGQLRHLDDLDDFKIAEGEPDIRGWDVRGVDHTKLGKVEDLLVDTAAMKVRYIEVKLEKDLARQVSRDAMQPGASATLHTDPGTEDLTGARDERTDEDAERYVLVPIGVARLDDDHDDVLLDAQAAQLVGIPAYHREALTRDYESHVLRGYGRVGDGTPKNDVMRQAVPSDAQPLEDGDAFYGDRTFDDRSFFGGRGGTQGDRTYVVRADEREGTRDRDTDRTTARRDRTLLDAPSDLDASVRDQIRDIRDR